MMRGSFAPSLARAKKRNKTQIETHANLPLARWNNFAQVQLASGRSEDELRIE